MPINTIMYHYVRNNENYPYDTYCRRIEEFRHQIDLFIHINYPNKFLLLLFKVK